MKTTAALAALVVIAVAACGCVSSVEERSTARGGLGLSLSGSAPADSVAEPDGHDDAPCIMEVPGTGIRMADTDLGMAVVFDTVEGRAVGDLRRAVRRLGAVLGGERRDDHRGHHSGRALAMAVSFHASSGELPPMITSVQDVPRGARLDVSAADPTQRALLRERMRAEIGMMQRGVCPLLGQ